MSTVPQRSTWDNSVLPGTSAPAAPSARSVPPGVLAPGGVDPATGQKFPTAFNGMLPSTPQAAPQPPQMGPQAAPQGWRPSWDIRPLENFMSGNSEWSPVAPKVNIPGFGQLPASAADIPMQTEGLEPMLNIPGFGQLPQDSAQYAPPRQQQEWIDIPGFGRIPKFR
jgi:hypothetical protein